MRKQGLLQVVLWATATLVIGTSGVWGTDWSTAAPLSASNPQPTQSLRAAHTLTAPLQAGQTLAANDGIAASWSWTELGPNLGAFGFFNLPQQKAAEIVISSGHPKSTAHWRVLQVKADGKSIKTTFRSPDYLDGIASVFPITAKGMKKARVGVALPDGVIQEFAADTRALLSSFTSPCASRNGLLSAAAADLYNDGTYEHLSLCNDQTLIVHNRQTTLWTIPNFNGSKILTGQVDGDLSLEIISQSGLIIDATTKAVQASIPFFNWSVIAVGDLDGDGRDEVVKSGPVEGANYIRLEVWNIETMKPSLTVNEAGGIDINLIDVDGDRIKEIVLGAPSNWMYRAYDSQVGTLKGTLTDHSWDYIKGMLVTDANKDGKPELIVPNTDAPQLFIADWASKSVTWRGALISGPFVGPEVGDVDGDGKLDIVFASAQSDALSAGKIIVVDATTMEVKAISDMVARQDPSARVTDLKLRDVDGDGLLDILIAYSRYFSGGAEAYKISKSGIFTRFWYTRRMTPYENTGIGSVDIGDIDGDGIKEIIGGTDNYGSSRAIWVFDITTGKVKYQSSDILINGASDTVVADTNGDKVSEVFSALDYNIRVSSGAALTQLEAPPVGSTSSINIRDTNTFTFSHFDGTISQHIFDNLHWRTVWTRRLTDSNTMIDGATDFGLAGLWAGIDGQAVQYDANGIYVRRSAKYGSQLGRKFVPHPDGKRILTCSSSGIFAFSR